MISEANNVWVLISAALVMFMIVPGLGLFYGGLVKRKNVLTLFMYSFAPLIVVSIIWVLFGYSLAFSSDDLIPGVLGNFKYALLSGISPSDISPYTGSDPNHPVSHTTFIMFQCMFAAITPAVIAGAIVERMKFSTFLVVVVVWTVFVYIPIAHMVWSTNGLFATMGIRDYAGGLVVEINSGFSALALALVLGKRTTKHISAPHNLVYTLIGAAMLWFGWFGFNAGSGLAADGMAGHSFMTTNLTACMGAFAWACIDWILQKKPTLLGVATGAVAGLVAITPAAGFVSMGGALLLGLLAGVICYFMVVFVKSKLGYDDSLDVFGVHGVAGVIGTIGVGLLADPFITKGFFGSTTGIAGAVYGNPSLLGVQALATIVILVFAFGMTWIIAKIVDLTMGLRVSEREEAVGLDVSQHNERGQTILE